MPEMFPEVQGGGSLILAWQVRNRKVLVVGGGEVRLVASHGLVWVLMIRICTGRRWSNS
jgi:hypothetical protein